MASPTTTTTSTIPAISYQTERCYSVWNLMNDCPDEIAKEIHISSIGIAINSLGECVWSREPLKGKSFKEIELPFECVEKISKYAEAKFEADNLKEQIFSHFGWKV